MNGFKINDSINWINKLVNVHIANNRLNQYEKMR